MKDIVLYRKPIPAALYVGVIVLSYFLFVSNCWQFTLVRWCECVCERERRGGGGGACTAFHFELTDLRIHTRPAV